MTSAATVTNEIPPIPGVLLAGGLARRMGGGDKPMRRIGGRPEVAWVLSAAADCPFLPRDLVARLYHARTEQNAQLAVAASGGQSHPVIGLWSVALREELRRALVVEDIRRVDRWTARYALATVTWPAEPFDPFFNANTVDDIAAAERLAELDGG